MISIRAPFLLASLAIAACASVPPQASTAAAPMPAASAVMPVLAPTPDHAAAASASSIPPVGEPPVGAVAPKAPAAAQAAAKDHAPALSAPPEKPAPLANRQPSSVTASAAIDTRVASPAAATATASGRIQISASSGQTIDPDEVTEAVVYFIPDANAVHPVPAQFQAFTRDKQFDPTTLVVPLGSTVSFPNKDEILHNVFSVSAVAAFDLGLYGEGKSKDYTFKKSGVAIINCNVHPMMQMSVLVLDTPHFAHPSKSGDFALRGLPAGPGKLMLWHPRAGMQSVALPTSASDGLTLQLVLNKPRVAPHMNKENKPYLAHG